MKSNVSPGTSANPSKDSPTCPGRDRRKPTQHDPTAQTDNKPPTDRGRLQLANSTVVLERGGAGTIARVERSGHVEYAGPLPDATVGALREVSR